jgi:hypothetical protein
MKVSSQIDLRRIVSDWAESLEIKHYRLSFDEICEEVSYSLLDLIQEDNNFEWGDEMPKVDDEKFWDLFKEWEKFED